MKATKIATPYYLIDERKLLKNLQIVKYIREKSGAKSVLALKCFSAWCVFPLIRQYMDGTTSSSLYETRLGYEKFKKETHAYSAAFSKTEINEIKKYADKIIFNSVSQLKMFYKDVNGIEIGLRINPGISYSHFDLANPARKFCRLGVIDKNTLQEALPVLNGVMFHFNCENNNFKNFSANLDYICRIYGNILKKISWVSLGGGIFFNKPKYPIDALCAKLKKISETFKVQIYLEPGEAIIDESAELVTKILDIVRNEIDTAIVDASTEAHMLDLLIYRQNAKIIGAGAGTRQYIIAGRSCLAGDVFGMSKFKTKLKPGRIIRIANAAGYTMVKKNWFNGLQMPSIAVKKLNGSIKIARCFKYKDFVENLS